MTRDIKLRYRIQVGQSVVTEIVILEEIESGDMRPAGPVLSRDEWTGMTDKNGTDIFENDVVKDAGDGLTVFEWVEGNGLWPRIIKPSFLADPPRDLMEVIGNTHSNPELLEVSA